VGEEAGHVDDRSSPAAGKWQHEGGASVVGHSAEEGRSKVAENSGVKAGQVGLQESTNLCGREAQRVQQVPARAHHASRATFVTRNQMTDTNAERFLVKARRDSSPQDFFAGGRACPQAHDRTCESTPREKCEVGKPARGAAAESQFSAEHAWRRLSILKMP
jgi:hypothetical protein